ncbi:hypothetical protein AMTR_s00061p00164940 [Amborella trichopoda]|uniref:Uncharacterized protein n=1 Tax=Amborella trichopoda TaxID=13333 RepID=U5D0N0_AMBTC|nr:hypothetical protein AMTR_s00061p00164940 [Amborella trichopoda]
MKLLPPLTAGIQDFLAAPAAATTTCRLEEPPQSSKPPGCLSHCALHVLPPLRNGVAVGIAAVAAIVFQNFTSNTHSQPPAPLQSRVCASSPLLQTLLLLPLLLMLCVLITSGFICGHGSRGEGPHEIPKDRFPTNGVKPMSLC